MCLPGGATRPPPVTSRSAADVDAPPWRSPPERSRPHTDLGEADPGIPKHPAWGDLCRVGAARRAGHRSSLSSVLKQHFRARPMRTERRIWRCSQRRPERSVCVVMNIMRSDVLLVAARSARCCAFCSLHVLQRWRGSTGRSDASLAGQTTTGGSVFRSPSSVAVVEEHATPPRVVAPRRTRRGRVEQRLGRPGRDARRAARFEPKRADASYQPGPRSRSTRSSAPKPCRPDGPPVGPPRGGYSPRRRRRSRTKLTPT